MGRYGMRYKSRKVAYSHANRWNKKHKPGIVNGYYDGRRAEVNRIRSKRTKRTKGYVTWIPD